MTQCLCDEREWGTQNGVNLRHELFISGIFNLIILDCGWPQAVETTDKGGYCIRKEKPAAFIAWEWEVSFMYFWYNSLNSVR